MLYISFAEILPEARDYMCCVTGSDSPAAYNGLGVLCFFLGAFLTWALHRVSHSVAAAGKKAVTRVRAGMRGLWGGRRGERAVTVRHGTGVAAGEAIARGDSSTALTCPDAPGTARSDGGASNRVQQAEVELPSLHARGGRVAVLQAPAGGSQGERGQGTGAGETGEDSVVLGELELQQALPREGFHHMQPTVPPAPSSTAGLQRRMTGEASSSSSSSTALMAVVEAQDAPLVPHSASHSTWDAAGQTYRDGAGLGLGSVASPLAASPAPDAESTELVRQPTLADYGHGHGHGHGVGPEGEEAKARLKAMGVLTGAAIFVHNIPEGMVTFIGALSSPRLGYALALAVALHNIPEGIAAAAPIYYATGNRKAAFWWGFVSGVSEPLGALVGYLALRSIFSPASFGAIFGLVAGMMVYIVVREALPTAHRYDPKDVWTTPSVFAGMAVMAASLLLFDL